MLPPAIDELEVLAPTLEDMLRLVARCANASRQVIDHELKSQLASRVFFLLLEDVDQGRNFDGICERVSKRLGISIDAVQPLVKRLAEARGHLLSSYTEAKSTLDSLAYYERRRMFEDQGYRCAYCGWHFGSEESPSRAEHDSQPSLDHRVVYRFGGDTFRNLVIACSLCNRLKGTTIHVAERGFVWIDNWTVMKNERVIAFWRLYRDGKCVICATSPHQSRLFVQRRDGTFLNALDSVETVCRGHVRLQATLAY